MSRPWLRHLWRANRWRLALVAVALALWGALLPVVYEAFGKKFEAILQSGIIPPEFARFGGGDIFSLTGSVALGFVHPLAVGLALVYAVGFAGAAIAGERQRGTLEVLLSRPVSRRGIYLTTLAASLAFIALLMAALTVGTYLGAAAVGRAAELEASGLAMVWLEATLLYGAIAGLSLAASVSFDRLTPAVGTALAIVLIAYFLDVIGQLWPAAAFLRPWSLFAYIDVRAALAGLPDPADVAVLAAVLVGTVVYALLVFPRRDLAAPA